MEENRHGIGTEYREHNIINHLEVEDKAKARYLRQNKERRYDV
jgi:hypothetical protein